MKFVVLLLKLVMRYADRGRQRAPAFKGLHAPLLFHDGVRIALVNNTTELFRWWIIDEATGERQLTKFKLSRENAQRAFPGAKPDLKSLEVHDFTDIAELATSRQDDVR